MIFGIIGLDKCLLRTLKAYLPKVHLTTINNPRLNQELSRMEELKKQETRRYKIGILYAKEGQTTEAEILGNRKAIRSYLFVLYVS